MAPGLGREACQTHSAGDRGTGPRAARATAAARRARAAGRGLRCSLRGLASCAVTHSHLFKEE